MFRDRVLIDETYITDISLIRNEDYKEMRRLQETRSATSRLSISTRI